MQRAIISFDQDPDSHWRAILGCGHRQHVRHEPPLVARPWVLTEAGRAARVGEVLNCVKCDREVVSLRTSRLALRELRLEDADHLVELDADPEVVRYVHLRKPTTADDARAWIAKVTTQFYESLPGFGFWAIVDAGGSFIGWFHLRPADGDTQVAEIGYRLRRDAWGRGYATELSLAAVGQAFSQLGVDRVVARALVANRASTRVMEKAGLSPARHFREPLTGGEAVEYALDRLPPRQDR